MEQLQATFHKLLRDTSTTFHYGCLACCTSCSISQARSGGQHRQPVRLGVLYLSNKVAWSISAILSDNITQREIFILKNVLILRQAPFLSRLAQNNSSLFCAKRHF